MRRLATIAVTAALLAATPHLAAAAPTAVGETSTNTGSGTCSGNATLVQTASAGVGYAVPTAGVVTRVSYAANIKAGQVRAVFLLPNGTDRWRVVATSEAFTVVPSTLNTFATRLPVQAGWLLGNWTSAADMNCNGPTGMVADKVRGAALDPTSGNDLVAGTDVLGYRVNVSVQVEPDVDGDGFGDETQDACPQSKLTQVACPAPETIVTRAPRKKSFKRKTTVVFASSVPGSTASCAVDKETTVPCASPFRRKYRPGKHTVVVTVTSPAGIVDPTPAVVTFKVKRKR